VVWLTDSSDRTHDEEIQTEKIAYWSMIKSPFACQFDSVQLKTFIINMGAAQSAARLPVRSILVGRSAIKSLGIAVTPTAHLRGMILVFSVSGVLGRGWKGRFF
jgi:hypothetical protein